MKLILALVVCVLAKVGFGQYTYFNYLYIPNVEFGSGGASNIFVKGDSIITFGLYSSDTTYMHRAHFVIDENGTLNEVWDFGIPNLEFWYLEYSESAIPLINGYLYSDVVSDTVLQKEHGRIQKFNNHFELQWEYLLQQYTADSIYGSEYNRAIQLVDGNYLGAGQVGADSTTETLGYTHANFLLTKIAEGGDVIWHKEYPFHLGDYFTTPEKFLRVSDLNELSNGDILAWGIWYQDFASTCFVLHFDNTGDFIAEAHWGNPNLKDWCPFVVPAGNDEFMYAYSHAVSVQDPDIITTKPRVGKLNPYDNSDVLYEPLNHATEYGSVTDFEKTPDGGFVILGYGAPDIFGEDIYAYMIRVDESGNEEWYHEYHPPISHLELNAYDLEVTSDGGLAFVGNFRPMDEPYFVTWVVKTDACGEEVFNGCPPIVGVEEMNDSKIQGFKVWPNPAANELHVECDEMIVRIQLKDVTGKIIFRESLNTLHAQLNISSVASGLYLLEVDFGNGKVMAQKIVVE